MKKIVMIFAAIFCCAMTVAVMTACGDKDDNSINPSGDVNKGIVINLGSIVIKPYLQMGASLADVEAYMEKNYADWVYTKDEKKQESIFAKRYTKDNKEIIYVFYDTTGSLRMTTYGFYNQEIPFSEIKTELERNGFIYQGKLNFVFPGAADVYQMFLSADKSIEVQYGRYEQEDSWAIAFQPFDEDDMNYLEPVNKGTGTGD